jgi:agmatinase
MAKKKNFSRRKTRGARRANPVSALHPSLGSYTAESPECFLGLPAADLPSYEDARTVVFPVPLDRTTSYMAGTKHGPAAILRASRYVETYDEELGCEPYEAARIATIPPLETHEGTLEKVLGELHTGVLALLADGKFPVVLGGEHSLTAPCVAAAAKKFTNLSVLQIDAHADLRDAYQGNPSSHASVMRRVVEICPAVQVGIRAVSAEEAEVIPELPVKVYWAKDIARGRTEEWVARVVSDLTENVYLTVDLDGFDPTCVPATGTPEPGGLDWYQVTALIRAVAARKRIVAMDVVELLPQPGDHASDFLAAKLIYKALGYIFCRR